MDEKKHVKFQGRLVFVGFGSIGQGTLPLILRHIDMPRDRITILTADDRGQKEAEEYGIKFVINPIQRDNVEQVLGPMLGKGDFLLNLSVDVSSTVLTLSNPAAVPSSGSNWLTSSFTPSKS